MNDTQRKIFASILESIWNNINVEEQEETSEQNGTLRSGLIGKMVIVRTESAGVWFGNLQEKLGAEVILGDARRMWRWWANQGISLSACALYGVKHDESKIVEPVASVWLEAIEIIPCTDYAEKSISEAPHVKAE